MKVFRYDLRVLNQCAWSAARTRDTYLSAQFWRLARRIGKKKAAVAVGHSILVIAWHLMTNGCAYEDLGGDYFVTRDADRARQRAISNSKASVSTSPSNPQPDPPLAKTRPTHPPRHHAGPDTHGSILVSGQETNR